MDSSRISVYWFEQQASFVPADQGWLSASEQAHFASFRFPKRRSDWRLGRWTVKCAVAACLKLSFDHEALTRIEIRASHSGAPEVFLSGVPAPLSISLTHRAGIAACAIGPSRTTLGCDLEIVEPRSDAFLADYFTAAEQQLMAQASVADRDRATNLLWSAKESALKAIGMGLRLDARAVVVSMVEGLSFSEPKRPAPVKNPVAGRSATDLWHAMQVDHQGGQEFQGWWQQTGPLLRTLVAWPAPKQPVFLEGNQEVSDFDVPIDRGA